MLRRGRYDVESLEGGVAGSFYVLRSFLFRLGNEVMNRKMMSYVYVMKQWDNLEL